MKFTSRNKTAIHCGPDEGGQELNEGCTAPLQKANRKNSVKIIKNPRLMVSEDPEKIEMHKLCKAAPPQKAEIVGVMIAQMVKMVLV